MLANAPSADNPHLPFCPPEHLMLGGTATRRPVNGYEFAKSVERVVLVDGARLTNLMIDHEVGVTMRPLRAPKIDSDYFDE